MILFIDGIRCVYLRQLSSFCTLSVNIDNPVRTNKCVKPILLTCHASLKFAKVIVRWVLQGPGTVLITVRFLSITCLRHRGSLIYSLASGCTNMLPSKSYNPRFKSCNDQCTQRGSPPWTVVYVTVISFE